jgi:Xaa-Pro aminopeptidase
MFDLRAIQKALGEFKLDGWLFYDFRGTNLLARRVLDFNKDAMSTRRFFYFVPAAGTPRKLVHSIEAETLDHLPGDKHTYVRWQELEDGVAKLVSGMKRVAMEYSPRNAIPYVSTVDAGTVELVRSLGVDIASSGDLIQLFEATLDDDQWQSHLESERHTLNACKMAFAFIAEQVRSGKAPREAEVQARIVEYFAGKKLITDHPPIVAVGPHSGDPHYEPIAGQDAAINHGDLVMIDLWARLDRERTVYSHYTRMAFVGDAVPAKYAEVFGIVARARDAAIRKVSNAFVSNTPLHGWQVDDAAREVIEEAGYGQYIRHRTGHNIAQDLHGNGTHIDNLETHDERRILRCTCFSIEPGIYMEEFGIRSEVNVFVDDKGHVHVTGEPQSEIQVLL